MTPLHSARVIKPKKNIKEKWEKNKLLNIITHYTFRDIQFFNSMCLIVINNKITNKIIKEY